MCGVSQPMHIEEWSVLEHQNGRIMGGSTSHRNMSGGGCWDRGRGVEWDEDTNLLVENNERERAELEALRP